MRESKTWLSENSGPITSLGQLLGGVHWGDNLNGPARPSAV
jgi:hypothetical protein